jgi:hypothetical protein
MVRRASPWALALLAGCASPTALEIELPAGSDARTVTVYLVSACAAVTPDGVPERPLAPPTLLRRGEASMALGPSPAAAFGVVAIARSAGCEIVAAGCADTVRGASRVRVVTAARAGSGCGATERCDDGACVVGAGDAGIDGSMDASDAASDARDAAPPACTPGCGATEVCSHEGCRPRRETSLFGSAGFAEAAYRDEDGSIYVAGRSADAASFDHVPGTTDESFFLVRVSDPESGPAWLTGVGGEGPYGAIGAQMTRFQGRLWIGALAGTTTHELTVAPAGDATCGASTALPSRRSGLLAPLGLEDGCPPRPLTTFPGVEVTSVVSHGDRLFVAGAVRDGRNVGEAMVGTAVIDDAESAIEGPDAARPLLHPVAWIVQWDPDTGVRGLQRVWGVGDVQHVRAVANGEHVCLTGHINSYLAIDGGPRSEGGPFVACFDPELESLQRAWSAAALFTHVESSRLEDDVLWVAGTLVADLTIVGAPTLTSAGGSDGWVGRFDLASGAVALARIGEAGDEHVGTLTRGEDGHLYASLVHDDDLSVGATSLRRAEGWQAILMLDEAGAATRAISLDLFGSIEPMHEHDGVGLALHVASERGIREITYVARAPGPAFPADYWRPFVIVRLRDEGVP